MTLPTDDLVERVLARVRSEGARDADLVLIESDSLEVRVRGDEIDHVKQARERTLGLRVFAGQPDALSSAVTSTSDLDPASVDRIVDETVALAGATAPDPCAGLPEACAEDLPDLELHDPADHPAKVEDRIAAARAAEAAARRVDPRITNSEGSSASSELSHVLYASSRGFRGRYSAAVHGLMASPLAEDESGKQTDYWFSAARLLRELDDPEEVGRIAGERAVARLGARPVPTAEVPVLYEPRAAASLLGHLAACLAGTAIYRGTSFLAGRLGQEIASPAISVIDDGRLRSGLGSKPFDGEGQATRRNTVIDAGRLESYLLDTYCARKLGSASTGNASRGAGSTPSPGPTNLWLEPGSGSLEDIVRDTERGFLVTGMLGHGFNPVTGDYSRGATGFWIEHGRRGQPVEEVTVAGNFADMLRGVDAVGGDLLRLGRLAAPSLRIARMTVAGT